MSQDHDQEYYLELQIKLQNEITALLNCNARLRHFWLDNLSNELMNAMESISERMGIAENELEAVLRAIRISEICPVKHIIVARKTKI